MPLRTFSASLSLLLLASVPALAQSQVHFKLGVLVCQSGVCAETGTSSLRGVELAAEEINNAGGILGRRIKLVVEDTREAEASAHAVSAFQKVTREVTRGHPSNHWRTVLV